MKIINKYRFWIERKDSFHFDEIFKYILISYYFHVILFAGVQVYTQNKCKQC